MTGGELKTSKLSWQNLGYKGLLLKIKLVVLINLDKFYLTLIGFINIDYYNSNGQTEISYLQGNDDPGVGPQLEEYLKAVFDEATSTVLS